MAILFIACIYLKVGIDAAQLRINNSVRKFKHYIHRNIND